MDHNYIIIFEIKNVGRTLLRRIPFVMWDKTYEGAKTLQTVRIVQWKTMTSKSEIPAISENPNGIHYFILSLQFMQMKHTGLQALWT